MLHVACDFVLRQIQYEYVKEEIIFAQCTTRCTGAGTDARILPWNVRACICPNQQDPTRPERGIS